MAMYQVADRLHITLDNVREMTLDEFMGWLAFYHLEAKRINNGKKS
tara:strand:- start:623 stop:760 length:138 start_codon:yes stop_codon:yes gene_type:complete